MRMELDTIAKSYVTLVHMIGLHQLDFVDAYYGREELKLPEGREKEDYPLEDVIRETEQLLTYLNDVAPSTDNEQRINFLRQQLLSAESFVNILSTGEKDFDREVESVFNISAPHYDDEYFLSLHDDLESALNEIENKFNLSFEGNLGERISQFYELFYIPQDKIKPAIELAVQRSKSITEQHIKLALGSNGEGINLGFVTGKPWIGYNYYLGDAQSKIDTNTEEDISLTWARILGIHEGYPGHHTYFSKQDILIAQGQNWIELTIYPLFSPMSTISEGLARYAETFTFNDQEEADLLINLANETGIYEKLAGLGIKDVNDLLVAYSNLGKLHRSIDTSAVEAARKIYGDTSDEEVVEWMMTHGLVNQKTAEQRLSFFKQYGSYIAAYTSGERLINDYIEAAVRESGSENLPADQLRELKWKVYNKLLEKPPIVDSIKDYIAAHF